MTGNIAALPTRRDEPSGDAPAATPTPAGDAVEDARLAALARYTVLDTDPEDSFDRITRLAAALMDVPIALLSFIDAGRQWFKSRLGTTLTQAPCEGLFCRHAIERQEPLVVEDARADPALRSSPLVAGEPGIRFYVALPLVTSDGFTIGTLAVADRKPGSASMAQIAALSDLSRLVMDELDLRQLATVDGLTGVLTRRALIEALDREYARIRRGRRGFCLVVMDIDRFKHINDTLGHPAGDQVLAQVARQCHRRLRSSDSMGRLGGEEFAMVLPETSLARAEQVAERMRQMIEETVFQVLGAPYRVTASFGIAHADETGPPPAQLIGNADRAMYEAKQSGRNRVAVADPPPDETAEGRARGNPSGTAQGR